MIDKSKCYFDSLILLLNWIEDNGYKGYEPFDGLSSFLRPLTFNSWFAERLLQQLVLRCPFHVRPLLGIRKQYSTKGMGYFAKGYLNLWKLTQKNVYKEKAIFCLDWLINNSSNGYSGMCWGNHFDYAARAFQLEKFNPTLVWSGLIGQAFLNGYQLLKDNKYLKVARSVCDFIMKDLPRTEFNDSFCISYVTFKKLLIHNANMIGAALLSRVYSITNECGLYEFSRKAIKFSCDSQLENGAWYYGEEPTYHWIDNWHTAYNLDSLKCFIESSGNYEYRDNLIKGYHFYKNNFFLRNGKPKYYYDKLRFIDIQCSSQSIDTFCYLSNYDQFALAQAQKIADWSIENMRDKSGYYYYRDLGWKKVKVPMLHWGQATMVSALSHLLLKLKDY